MHHPALKFSSVDAADRQGASAALFWVIIRLKNTVLVH